MSNTKATDNVELLFDCDWKESWTAAEFEEELAPTKFRGQGWYLSEGDTLLVVPLEFLEKDPTAPERYRVYCWNRAVALETFKKLITLPAFNV